MRENECGISIWTRKSSASTFFYFVSCGDTIQMSGVTAKYLLEEINRTEREELSLVPTILAFIHL